MPSGSVRAPGPGFAGQILRVDLSAGSVRVEPFEESETRRLLGGAGLGAKVLYDEVPPHATWDHPDNRLVMATGPLAGTVIWGTGVLTVVTRGALTGGATSTQANGFFGTNLKSCGFDAVVIQGRSARWTYLAIEDGTAELRDAEHLLGKDTWETQRTLQSETGLQGHRLSVYSIGPAGENLVRFAAIQGDFGHVASKNGCGAVMGGKRLKAVAIARGRHGVKIADPDGVRSVADVIAHDLKTDPSTRSLYELGTLPAVANNAGIGALPIRNYTTNVVPLGVDFEQWEGHALRDGSAYRGHQCSACGMRHCQMHVIPEGEHKGALVDEPEYEGWASCGWTIGVYDPFAAAWLNGLCDRAAVDANEFGWVIGWVMECFEKGYLTSEQLGGLEPRWGNVSAAEALLGMICRREGIGDLLADGVKRASERIGGPAAECAVYTMKGSSPRGHDHRAIWHEMLDTCTASTGTIEAGRPVRPRELGLPGRVAPHDAEAVPETLARLLGRRHFEDSLGACAFTTRTTLENVANALSAVTGWNYTKEEAMRFGRRVAATLRAFDLRCGIGPEREYPSARYGSTPADGPAAGHSSAEKWGEMLNVWYRTVRYDRLTGRPLPDLLDELDLPQIREDLWGHEDVKGR